MRFVKLAIISFLLLFGVITVFSLFIPSSVRISKAINILASPASVWSKVGDTAAWHQWNTLKTTRQVEWVRRDSGEHIARIHTSGASLISGWKCIEHVETDSLTVQWYIDFRLRWYPWEKFRSLLFEKTYGPQMEQGLANLKYLLEK